MEIAVLSPYQAQRKGSGHYGSAIDWFRQVHAIQSCRNGRSAPITIVVSTTDGFQGQEADIVIISLVQTHGHGFLDSPNRMNVAITRAREWRVIVGNFEYFARDNRMRDPMLRSLALTHSRTKQKSRGK